MEEVKNLSKPTIRYWGKEKAFYSTIVILDGISNDYPERCFNASIADLEIFTHRWGYSCVYNDKFTPSCDKCELARIQKVLSDEEYTSSRRMSDTIGNPPGDPTGGKASSPLPIKECCLDWWSSGRNNVYGGMRTSYPVKPGKATDLDSSIPSVQVSFKMIMNEIKELQHWAGPDGEGQHIAKRSRAPIAKMHLDNNNNV